MFFRLVAGSLMAAALVGSLSTAVQAQVQAPYETREERDFYGTGQGSDGTILDASNPMDLINRLRQNMSMNEATPPSDAIDAALKAYETQPAGTP